MKKLISHFRLWYEWQKNCLNKPFYKVMVLLGVCHSPTFYDFTFIKKVQLAHPDITIRFCDGELPDNKTTAGSKINLKDLEKELP